MRGWMIVAGLMLGGIAPAWAQEALPIAKPIGSPGAWIPANGYPPAAKASAEEGRVGFTLMIDETGRASDCKVTSSSESPLLDETTCTFMVANGRFEPPKDKRGRAVQSRWSSSVRWRLERDAAPSDLPPASPAPAPVSVPPLPPASATPKPTSTPAAPPARRR